MVRWFGSKQTLASAVVAVFGSLLTVKCQSPDLEIPPGHLARVDQTMIGPPDLADIVPQLGAYAQARFRGQQGSRVLLDSFVDLVTLEHAALDAGLSDSPTIRWGVLEELADLELAAELERRVTRLEFTKDKQALLAYYHEHIDRFTEAEKRSIWFVSFPNWTEAEQALVRFRRGEIYEEEQKNASRTVLEERNDHDFPLFHAVLFDPGLKKGDWLPRPVMAADYVMVAKVDEIVPGKAKSFEDPKVQEQILSALIEPRIQSAKREILQELALRYDDALE